ncbi:hypothetical protein [Lichenifustis flavocetrariae]|uniref:Uncharacterized protein n=1 Tax=Lichenifustis flavocetrariae TaxID=2949735 RepID=A0AA42CQW9_9HYPH|nr:hypothetical protein [Lichenifustis flavocetrariae]MCW6511855.1 hypothetical protein [Lichenifustis flavocetrariae]
MNILKRYCGPLLVCSGLVGVLSMPAAAEPAPAARAALLLGTFDNPDHPQISVGEVRWHAEADGDAIRADVALPGTGADLTIQVRSNTDPSLPVDYTIELRFTAAETSFQDLIETVAPPTLRATEGAVGQPLAATVVPISARVYLVGLPHGPDADKDATLLRSAEWFDLPIKLTGNRLAKITFEEGMVGHQALDRVFKRRGGQ